MFIGISYRKVYQYADKEGMWNEQKVYRKNTDDMYTFDAVTGSGRVCKIFKGKTDGFKEFLWDCIK